MYKTRTGVAILVSHMEKANDVPNANPPKIEKPKGKEALLVTI